MREGERLGLPSLVSFEIAPVLACLSIVVQLGCTATDADCDALGEHYMKIAIAEAQAQNIPADFVQSVAQETQKELVQNCKTAKPSKREIDCRMKAESIAELKACEG